MIKVYMWVSTERLQATKRLNLTHRYVVTPVALKPYATLIILVFSRRDALSNRDTIRQTWSCSHKNVFFMVGEYYCPYPPEQRVAGICRSNDKHVLAERLQKYQREEEEKTACLRRESHVVLLPEDDEDEHLTKKVIEAYKWVLKNTTAGWILIVYDDSFVRVKMFEEYLNKKHVHSDYVVIRSGSLSSYDKLSERNDHVKYFQLGSLGFAVSRVVVKSVVENTGPLIEYPSGNRLVSSLANNSSLKHKIEWRNSGHISNNGNCRDNSNLVVSRNVSASAMHLCFRQLQETCYLHKHEENRQNKIVQNIISERPANYLLSSRFDLIIKTVYAYFYSRNRLVPEIFRNAYAEHIRVWNNFKEDKKRNKSDFITGFHDTINSIQKNGFISDHNMIPVDKRGFPFNGAHRIAASIVLSTNATFRHLDSIFDAYWNYRYFIDKGLGMNLMDPVMLEWMNIQRRMPGLTKTVFILSLFSNNSQHDEAVFKIIKEKCSKDHDILYQRAVDVTRHGMKQLVRHMYGNQTWIDIKTEQLISKITLSTYKVSFVFFFGKSVQELNECKFEIRKLYNDEIFKSTVHITDNPEESLVLAEMILNPNSVEFLNNAKNGNKCQTIANELAVRSIISPVKTLPAIYIGRIDLMIGWDSVLHLFGLRNGSGVDILFLFEADMNILGERNGMRIYTYAFEENNVSAWQVWRYHLSESVKTKWDLFYDPANYGFCYGIKFLSPIRHKMERGEPKDLPS